jgi:hypothetical protein
VYDLDPQLGNKTLACAALGLPYSSPVSNKELADYVGLKLDTGAAGLVIADACFNRNRVIPATEPSWYTTSGGVRPTLLLYLPQEQLGLGLPTWLGRPRWRLRVVIDPLRRNPDYLLCF